MGRAAREDIRVRAELAAKVEREFQVPGGVRLGLRVLQVQTEAPVWMDPTGNPAQGLK